MIALRIKNTRQFMSVLLASEVFDGFLLESAELVTANTYTIDGRVNKEFFGDEDDGKALHELSEWKTLRPVCYELIKGKHTPLGFKFIMCISPEEKEGILQEEMNTNISSLVFILRFKDGVITLTTGAALSGFLMDKSYETIWDDYMKRFLDNARIEYEEDY
ncbi:DUF5721 family protein [Butyrivibrio sp. AE3004]|uniref:DUF5721 family protein n=1 Tax=Butyrivibrio sp. AE3004 TaxID=1506994 RepID=UPI0004946414|nr:DUF5721 family protein [Butyrivibrio sp. AE3004]